MKFLTTLILFCLFTFSLNAQVRPYMNGLGEWTVSGVYGGGSIGGHIFDRLTTEVFYLRLVEQSEVQFDIKQHSWGGALAYTFYKSENGNYAKLQLRSGFSNTRFFVLWPTLVIGFKLKGRFDGLLINGIRFESPSLGVGLKYNLEGLFK